MSSIAINQSAATSFFASREVSHLQVIATLQAPESPATTAATEQNRPGFLATLLRTLAAIAV